MSNTDTRTLLERACAKAIDIMLTGDDVATVRQGTGHHVVTIRTVESDEREARTAQRRVEHAEKARADTERELARVVDELAHVRETGAAELARASDDLVSAAVEIERQRQRADAAEQMVAELSGLLRSAHQAVVHEAGIDDDAQHLSDTIDAALSRTEAVAGRWHSKDAVIAALSKAGLALSVHSADTIDAHIKRVREDFDAILTERDAAIAARDEADREYTKSLALEAGLRIQLEDAIAARDEAVARLNAAEQQIRELVALVGTKHGELVDEEERANTAERARDEVQAKHDALRMEIVGAMTDAGVYMLDGDNDPCAPGEVRAAVRKLAAARDEVGIQLAAAQAEIARMRPVVALLMAEVRKDDRLRFVFKDALRALDIVPGDALAPDGLDDDTIVKCEGCSVVLPIESAVDGSDGDGGIWLCTTCADDLARDSSDEPYGAPFDEAATVNPDKLTAARAADGTRVALLDGLLREAQQWVREGPLSAKALDGRITAALDAVPGDALAPTLKVESGAGFEVHRTIHATWAMTPSERRVMDRLMAGEFVDDEKGQTMPVVRGAPFDEAGTEHQHRPGCMVPMATRDDLIRLVVGMQWVEAVFRVYTDEDFESDDSGMWLCAISGLGLDYPTAVDIVDEWLGVR